MKKTAYHISGTTPRPERTPQMFILTRTDRLDLNGHQISLNAQQIANLRDCEERLDNDRAFALARKYWHK